MSAQTQINRIMRYCERHGSITVRDAFELDINSPTKRISEMRHSGLYDVSTIKETRVNSAGEKVSFKRYFISQKPKEDREACDA